MAWTDPSTHIYATGEVVSAATMNTFIEADLAFLYGDAAWTAPTFTNSWVNFGVLNNNVGFRLVGPMVYFRGTMSGGTMTTTAFTLPLGYRPTGTCNMPVVTNAAFGYVVVQTSGAVIPFAGSNAWFSLEGCFFSTL